MSEVVTAMVIVREPGTDVEMLVDSSNVGQIVPAEATVEKVRSVFADQGFDVTTGFAGTFSITAAPDLFARLLPALGVGRVPLDVEREPTAETSAEPNSANPTWLAEVADFIAAITQSDPIDYGPVDP